MNISLNNTWANMTGHKSNDEHLNMSDTTRVVIFVCEGLIFLIGFLGNAMVIHFISTKNKHMSSCDIQIISLATADILTAIFTPIVSYHDLITKLKNWYLIGTFGCKIFVTMGQTTTLVSVLTLVVISIERLR